MVDRRHLRNSLHAALVRGIRRFGERVFALSQNTASCYVPRDTGMLARSGYTKRIEDGIEIGYVTPYAAKVEFGNPFIPFSDTQTVRVRPFMRTQADGTQVRVAAHTRTYSDARLIGFRPKLGKFSRGPLIFRVLRGEPERPGQFYLSRALVDSLPHLANDISFELRRIPGSS